MRLISLFTLIFCSLIGLEHASACSNSYPNAGEVFTWPVGRDRTTLPSNFSLLQATLSTPDAQAPESWRIKRGDEILPLAFELGGQFAYGPSDLGSTGYWWVPTTTAREGDVLDNEDCVRCTMFNIVGADLDAPATPVLRFISLAEPAESTCDAGLIRALDFEVTAPPELLNEHLILVYAARTRAELDASARALRIENLSKDFNRLRIRIDSSTRSILSVSEPFCVAIQLVDAANNASARSDAMCFSPDDFPDHGMEARDGGEEMGHVRDMSMRMDMGRDAPSDGAEEGIRREESCAITPARAPKNSPWWLLWGALVGVIAARGVTPRWRRALPPCGVRNRRRRDAR